MAKRGRSNAPATSSHRGAGLFPAPLPMLAAHTYEAAIHAALFLLGHESPWRPDMIRGRSTYIYIYTQVDSSELLAQISRHNPNFR